MMQALFDALEPLAASLSFFSEAREQRVLHVVTPSDLREAVLAHVAAMANDETCAELWTLSECPYSEESGGFHSTADELQLYWRELAEALRDSSDGPSLEWPSLDPIPDRLNGDAALGSLLQNALRVLPQPFDGLVVVLAPAAFSGDLQSRNRALVNLITARSLQKVRWVVVDENLAYSAPAFSDNTFPVERVDVRLSRSEEDKLLNSLRTQVETAGHGHSLRSAVGARPNVQPPYHPAVTEENSHTTDESERVQTVAVISGSAANTTLVVPTANEPGGVLRLYRTHVLAAADAARKSDWSDAEKEQRMAAAVCGQGGLAKEKLLMELLLGAYLLQAAKPPQAREVFSNAVEAALLLGFHAEAIQAALYQASTFLIERRYQDAAQAYLKAAELGKGHEEYTLAIEAYRLAGEVFAMQNDAAGAANAWRAALELGESTGSKAIGSNAPEAGRALAAYCKKLGLRAQAESLLLRVAALEAQMQSVFVRDEQTSALHGG